MICACITYSLKILICYSTEIEKYTDRIQTECSLWIKDNLITNFNTRLSVNNSSHFGILIHFLPTSLPAPLKLSRRNHEIFQMVKSGFKQLSYVSIHSTGSDLNSHVDNIGLNFN